MTVKHALVLVGVLGLFALLLWKVPGWLAGWSGTPDAVVQAERARADSIQIKAKADSVHTDSVVHALQDSAAVATQGKDSALAAANLKAQRIAYLLAHPKVISYNLTPGDSGPPVPSVDTVSSCEERYELRTGEAADLRLALTLCDRAGSLQGMRADTLGTANGRLMRALAASDSARKVEIVRPRPCKRDLVVAHPSCSLVDVLLLGAGVTVGVMVTR